MHNQRARSVMPDEGSTETWRPVVGFPDYEVSDQGRVRSWRRGKWPGRAETPRMMRPLVTRGGYPSVVIGERTLIHVLVLEAFAGPRPQGMDACHNNGIKTDNRPENLRWDTRKENQADRRRHGTYMGGDGHPLTKLSEAGVAEMRRLYASGVRQRELVRLFGMSPSVVCGIVNGKMRTTTTSGVPTCMGSSPAAAALPPPPSSGRTPAPDGSA